MLLKHNFYYDERYKYVVSFHAFKKLQNEELALIVVQNY